MDINKYYEAKINMTHKDLAGEYLTKAQENAIYFKDGNFPNIPLYQENDIKAAFNAGRESVVESLPELEWKGYAPFIHAATPIGRYNIDNFGIWLLRFNGKEIPLSTYLWHERSKRQEKKVDYECKRVRESRRLFVRAFNDFPRLCKKLYL